MRRGTPPALGRRIRGHKLRHRNTQHMDPEEIYDEQGAYFVTWGGEVVDEGALIEALKSRRLGGALDVFERAACQRKPRWFWRT